MKPDKRFLSQPREFWANVRLIGQATGYSVRGKKLVKVPTLEEIRSAFDGKRLRHDHLVNKRNCLGKMLLDYFEYRATMLNEYVEPRLMSAGQAKALYNELRKTFKPTCPMPMNKQRGRKKAPAYLTCIVNMLVEAHSKGAECDFDPRELTIVTRDGTPLRTLARRVDGAYPSVTDPVAIWEIKEYYHTTTFGSRVADGIYETLLDGMELQELREHEGVVVQHYLMIDAYYTWWECGRSYLCRIFDMLHMGYVDEVLFGKEVVERLPALVRAWAKD
ncbi:MAG: hypothetical protein GWP05_04395 [Anaerolineaceae bacterium]|nr:hypothetical protein [Anaerolineaceae bacterium]